ncbi:GDSL-type esterase/lipase family protein [Sandaracinus amylolyticus]|uniref:GDSL-type esterase/lipase family protein n=1 Tax=Sandaracinus amylolyticus TaxID=927083 RepID=UPI001F1F08F1|nr:GDSL-type esterase/lipase family protein [Sandaracinus amylolyticus]UJR78885.1 GDSL-like Lipase/Acylhydrolase family protein [Sandaracinus amylolyticus]
MATTKRAPWEEKPYGLDDPCDATPEEARRGVVHLAIVAAVFVVIALVTYLVPLDAMHALRPWEPGEEIPIARLYGREASEVSSTAIATGGGGAGGPQQGALDDSVLANLEEEEEAPAPEIEPTDPAQRASGVRIDPSELEGLAREIEDPNGTAMRAFYDALYRTAAREPGAITRVAHYGDSSIALDGITQTVRERMQHRFGDAGHGFVLAARGSMPYRHRGVRHESSDAWRLMDITHLPLSDGHYGYGGYQARSISGATAEFATAEEGNPVGTHASRFEVLYERHPRGGRFEIRVDGGEPQLVDTRGEPVTDDVHRVVVPDGPHEITIRTVGHGESHLYGVVLERDGPGVVYDSLGMVGARARRFLGFDRAHLARQLEQRGTNLVVIGYGGNDADDDRDEAQFEEDFRQVARLVRQARPEASCLLFAPLDQAERDERGRIRTLETVPMIVRAMRRAAQAEGCAFFDTWSAMGGEGGMERWFRSRPRLAFGDFRHATPAGYRVIGNMLYKALLKGFSDYLERR